MATATILRLFRFRPVRIGFDAVLRDTLIPELAATPSVVNVVAGRTGPDETGPRLVATTWTDAASMIRTVGATLEASPFHPEHLASTTDRDLLWLPLTFAFPEDGTTPVAIIRLVEGQVRAGELPDYIDEARDGTAADRTSGSGPAGLYLAARQDDRFVTLSLWPGWDALLTATGGDYQRPISTRHAERLVDWRAQHYEALPDLRATASTG
jgi:hypothetical protein